MKRFSVCLLVALCAASLSLAEVGKVKIAAERSRVVVVQPVILCDDDGEHPARFALPKALVDRVYSRADLEFLYLDPVKWNYGEGRRGEVKLDEIVKAGHGNGMITKDFRMVTLLFVSAVEGRKGPLGRGLQGGNICFVSLGPEDVEPDPAMVEFVVAHEVGHCLGLIHVVDDPEVPDDVPNLQGDGEFEDRLAVEGLHPTQVETVLKSPLVLPRVHFESKVEGARHLTEDLWGNPLETLTDDNIRFELGLGSRAELPEDAEIRMAFIRPGYTALVDVFTDEEREQIRGYVKKLDELVGGGGIADGTPAPRCWPMMSRLPWHFVKVDRRFCRALPHTRGLSIYVSGAMLEYLRTNEVGEKRALEVLLHEKLHVVQRLMPRRFEEIYRGYGFEAVTLAEGTAQRLNLVRNPDAPDLKWAIRRGDGLVLLATSLVENDGVLRFVERAYALRPVAGEVYSHEVGDLIEGAGLADWKARFPIRHGFDDPREIMAYLQGKILMRESLGETEEGMTDEQGTLLDAQRAIFSKVLGLATGD